MSWKESDVKSERIAFAVRARQPGRNMAALCREFGICRETGYKWLRRSQEVESLAELEEQSRRPHRSPNQTPEWIEERVEALRHEHGWGGRKLAELLSEEGIFLARSTVDRILKRRGLVDSGQRHRPAVRRFERSRPMELVQMDFKGPYRLPSGRICYPLSVLDDHSRYALRLDALPSQYGHEVQSRLVACFEEHGVPQAMLMDHGNPWWATTNGHGLTRLSVFLIRQGIDLIYGGIGHPQTQGKVERFHRTLGESIGRLELPQSLEGFQAAFDVFRRVYNHVRPHEALRDRPPAQRYHPSRKSYRPEPPEWEYPAGSEVYILRHNGCLRLEGRYYFVCHPLAGERVRLERFDRKILVTYRHMQVREIDLETGRTTAVVRPVRPPEVSAMS
jgi:transposase InsO family protein